MRAASKIDNPEMMTEVPVNDMMIKRKVVGSDSKKIRGREERRMKDEG